VILYAFFDDISAARIEKTMILQIRTMQKVVLYVC